MSSSHPPQCPYCSKEGVLASHEVEISSLKRRCDKKEAVIEQIREVDLLEIWREINSIKEATQDKFNKIHLWQNKIIIYWSLFVFLASSFATFVANLAFNYIIKHL